MTNEFDVRDILRAEAERRECEGCEGLPCRKVRNKCWLPVVNDGGVYGISIARAPCVYGAEAFVNSACRHAGVPRKYVGKTFDDYEVTTDNQRAVKLAKAFCERRPKQGLFFYGECGTGKTFLAALIAREFIADWQRVIFGDVPTLLNEIKRTFDGKGSAQEILGLYTEADLLILDDLGVGKITDWNVDIVYQVLNARYNCGKPTIVTSNYDLKSLPQHLKVGEDDFTGKRIASRISEMCVPAFLGTTDRRLRRKSS